jgi:hypothetical protein
MMTPSTPKSFFMPIIPPGKEEMPHTPTEVPETEEKVSGLEEVFNRHTDSAGVYYSRALPPEHDSHMKGKIKMIAKRKDGVWVASKKLFPCNEVCIKKGKKVGSDVLYNYAVLKGEGDEESFVVMGHHRRHTHITDKVFEENSDLEVRYAGQIAFSIEGKIAWWDNCSDHYTPLSRDASDLGVFPEEKFWPIEEQRKYIEELDGDGVVHDARKVTEMVNEKFPGASHKQVLSVTKAHSPSFKRYSPRITPR